MTDELVKRLRAVDHMSLEDCFCQSSLYDQAADRIEQLTAERDRLREDLEELDFLRHEGGPDSVAAIEAERDRLREALHQIEITCDEEVCVRTAGMSEAALGKSRILPLLQIPRNIARAALKRESHD